MTACGRMKVHIFAPCGRMKVHVFQLFDGGLGVVLRLSRIYKMPQIKTIFFFFAPCGSIEVHDFETVEVPTEFPRFFTGTIEVLLEFPCFCWHDCGVNTFETW